MNPNIIPTENIFKTAMEKSPDSILILNEQNIIIFANEAASNLFETLKPLLEGVKCSELLGTDFYTKEILPLIKACKAEEKHVSVEKELSISQSGCIIALDVIPADTCCQLVFRNITKSKHKEKTLIDNEQKYKSMYETAPLAFQSLDNEGCFLDVNPAWLKILGYEKEEVMGKWFGNFLHQDFVEKFRNQFPELIRIGFVHDVRFRMRRKDGNYIFVSFEGCIGKDQKDNFKQTYCTFKDITAQFSAESIKQDFLTNMSHELRTPLNGIMGMLTILRQEEILPHQQQYLELAWKSSENLYAKVKDILNVTSITNKEYNIKKEQFELVSYIKHLVELSRKEAEENGLELVFSSSVEECHLKEDRCCLSQIILHLISNSIKFSSTGTISVTIKHDEKICITIKDEGIGIPENKLEEIFDPFRQLEDPYTKTYSGMGIGLAIVKAMTDMIQAELTLKSKENEGSEFSILLLSEDTFCMDKNSEETDKIKPVTPVRHTENILIAEDEFINRIYLKQILTDGHRKIEEASDGIEAVEQFKKNNPDLILMDIGMPNMNGLEAIKAIRKLDSEVPIIAITAYVEDKNKNSILDAGANEIILKPFNKEEVLAKINKN